MQITLDTTHLTDAKLTALIVFLRAALACNSTIAPEDRPDAGKPEPTTAEMVAQLQARVPAPPVLPVPPSIDVNPAVVFGNALPLPPTAVTLPAAPASTDPNAVELDSKGLPWDVRIHGSNRTKNQDGSWRKKKGLNDDAMVGRIEAELRQVQALPAAPASIVNGSATPLPPAPPVPPTAEAVFGTPSVTPPMPPVASPTTFPELMIALTPAMSRGSVTNSLLTEACQAVGLPSLPLLATRPDLVSAVFEHIKGRAQL